MDRLMMTALPRTARKVEPTTIEEWAAENERLRAVVDAFGVEKEGIAFDIRFNADGLPVIIVCAPRLDEIALATDLRHVLVDVIETFLRIAVMRAKDPGPDHQD